MWTALPLHQATSHNKSCEVPSAKKGLDDGLAKLLKALCAVTLQYTMKAAALQYTMKAAALQYTMKTAALHYTMKAFYN